MKEYFIGAAGAIAFFLCLVGCGAAESARDTDMEPTKASIQFEFCDGTSAIYSYRTETMLIVVPDSEHCSTK